MSSSTCQWISLRTFFFSILVAVGFIVLFFTYYKPDNKFPSFDIYMNRGNHSCPPVVCAHVAQTKDSSPNCSTELNINPHQNDIQKIQAAAVDTEPDTIVLIWMWPFGFRFDLNCNIFNFTKCHLTVDKKLYQKAHGVLFHHRNINKNSMPKKPRPWFQKWVWLNMESPANSVPIPELNHSFNLTCNYRRDADIHMHSGYLVPVMPEDESFKLPAKNKLVCWIVSKWKPHFRRVQFFNELKKHINISTYGNAFGKRVSKDDYKKIVSSCKFYLAFENSIYRDYITEKTFKPLMYGTVPVTLGPPRENYEEHILGDSFIHVEDFPTAKELVEWLLYLDQNNTEYMKYFTWRNRYKVERSKFGREAACKTCQYLQNHKRYKVFHNLNKWYWG